MKPARFLAIAFAALLLAGGCGGGDAPGGETVTGGVLPRPDVTGGMALNRTLDSRECVRSFRGGSIDRAQVSQLLWSGVGRGATDSVTGATSPAPSAGGIYPLDVYLAERDEAYRYVSATGALEPVSDFESSILREALRLGADGSSTLFVLVVDIEKSRARYGGRAERYVYLEAGHAAQNMLLEAVSLGLGAYPVGAFDDGEVAGALRLRSGFTPVYVIVAGRAS